MKLSVLLTAGASDRVALDTVQNIAGQSGELVKDIFLIIAGDFTEDDRKKLYLERASAFGMTAFINIGGKSEAELLNTFIKYANADYCTVMRAGGKVDPSYFSRLIAALDSDPDLNIACGRLAGSGKNIFFPTSVRAAVIDLDKNFRLFPSAFEAVVVRTSFAAEHHFDTEAGDFTEQKCMLKALCEQKKFFYDDRLTAWLAERKTSPAKKDILPENADKAETYTAIFDNCLIPLAETCKGKDGRLPLFLQHFITAKVLECNEKGLKIGEFPEDERTKLTDSLQKVLRPAEDKVICDVYGIFSASAEEKRLLLGLKHGHENYFPDISYNSDRLFSVQKDIVLFDSTRLFIEIVQLNLYKNNMEIDGCFDNIFSERRTKLTAEYAGEEYKINYDRKGEPVMFFGKKLERQRTFHLSIPVSEERAELRFFILFKGCKYELRTIFHTPGSRIEEGCYESIFPLGNNFFARAENGRLVTLALSEKAQRRAFRGSMKRAAEEGTPFILRTAYRFTRFWFKNKNIWLFADDTRKGGGAAEDMFRYAMTRHDELYCYYLTDKESPAAQRIIDDGYKPLYRGTLLHKLIFLNAQVYITTVPNILQKNFPGNDDTSYSLTRLSRTTNVFLQNSPEDKPSVSRNHRLHDNVRLYFCGTGDYIDELRKPEYGYENTEVLKLTGLTSFDLITNNSEGSDMLLMLAKYVPEEQAPFKETGFFNSMKELLENEKLKTALNDSGYSLTMAFEGVTNDEAKALPKPDKVTFLTDDFSAEELKSRAALIVTDDPEELSAGIMRKPLVYFGTEGKPFGEKADTPEQLADILCGYIENGMNIKEGMSQKADEYLGKAHDGCKREIYNNIITYLYDNHEIDGYEDFEVADNYDEEND
ncbi:MAG: hypothetical protein J5582_13915 [Ruminococcus sp.]|uniref:hypothetical protein n=1 Tax=Ruminococcus sp. TaxID=41978 RepID=UPI0025EA52F6|nr:hypothetical protein [Ruminococcus sp.]MBO4867634.1 hypothetical protein [Ruminococcus sp.]